MRAEFGGEALEGLTQMRPAQVGAKSLISAPS